MGTVWQSACVASGGTGNKQLAKLSRRLPRRVTTEVTTSTSRTLDLEGNETQTDVASADRTLVKIREMNLRHAMVGNMILYALALRYTLALLR